jgi:superfamily II DNA/RNA helicase
MNKKDADNDEYDNKEVTRGNVKILVLAPARELVMQIFKVIKEFQDIVPDVSMMYLIGGNKVEYDI